MAKGFGSRAWPRDDQAPIWLSVNQTNHFINLGYGWLCKHCSAEDAEARQSLKDHPRPSQTEPAHEIPLARWTDASRLTLQCPRCGIEEMVSKA